MVVGDFRLLMSCLKQITEVNLRTAIVKALLKIHLAQLQYINGWQSLLCLNLIVQSVSH